MPSAARSAQGTKLYVWDVDSSTYVRLPELRNVTAARTRANINVTNHDSADRTIEYKKALKEPGKLQADAFFEPEDAGNALMETLYEGELIQFFILEYPPYNAAPQGYRLGEGYVDDLSETLPSDGNMQTRKVQIQRTGAWPLTLGATDFSDPT